MRLSEYFNNRNLIKKKMERRAAKLALMPVYPPIRPTPAPSNKNTKKNIKKNIPFISKDIALFMLKENKMAAFLLYLTIKNEFSGKFNSIKKLAEFLDKRESYVKNKIAQLIKVGLLEKQSKGWYFIFGVKRWNVTMGIMNPVMVELPANALYNVKTLRNYCRSIQITMAGRKAKKTQGVKGFAPVQSPSLSNSYIAMYSGITKRTVMRHKKQAKENGFALFRPQYLILESGPPGKIPLWKEMRNAPNQVIARINGQFCLAEQLPSILISSLSYHKKRIKYTIEDINSIKNNFTYIRYNTSSKKNKTNAILQEKQTFSWVTNSV